jgi:maleate isomerase
MYGWRARLALIIAHSNAVIEPEFNRLVPEGVSVHASRVRIGGVSVEGNQISNERMRDAVSLLADINARVFVWACTAANMAAGVDGDLAQARLISEMTGVPTIPTASALVEALTALEAKRIAIATPYSADLNESTEAFWRASGFEVLKMSGVDLGGARKPCEPLSSKPISQVGIQTPHVAYNLARTAFDARADAVVISGAGMRTIEVAAQFERDYGVTFISSALATAWAALQAAHVCEPISGFGRLMQEQPEMRWVRIPRVSGKVSN